MSRLIDADALMKAVKQHHDFFSGAMVDSDKARRDELHQVMADIVNAPAIDAIPVEWLEAQIYPYRDNLRDEAKGVFNATVKAIIYRWQKEQEVHNEHV